MTTKIGTATMTISTEGFECIHEGLADYLPETTAEVVDDAGNIYLKATDVIVGEVDGITYKLVLEYLRDFIDECYSSSLYVVEGDVLAPVIIFGQDTEEFIINAMKENGWYDWCKQAVEKL